MQMIGRHNNIEIAIEGNWMMHKIRDKWIRAEGKVPAKLDGEMGYDYRIRVMYEYLEFNTFTSMILIKDKK